ncbi:tRNA 2-selenouridine(34) synthase MnmH [Ferruginibacter paludis]|uniref:tRNA 2-selenouridine(34) synthase MnmH n=1 Tax=Ferruginibacter paludis TaxID=1310417 RepID=UPI0025B5FB36|nr:tRNA 2-selenouridine(34) synthase MnmH [Ferruginibacter paludis]MDN3659389.1 tRNA 2-selenouridine(34) synthase MnmH [Ferruginibacter paludis]
MAIQKILIDQFLMLASQYPVLDVRSPGEYAHAHIPGAYSLPLFTDEERKVVGTAYKQQSRKKAIKIGLDYFGVKMRPMVEEAERLVLQLNDRSRQENDPVVLVHCWRGGMRSAGVAWLLDLYGFKVYTLTGGYKMYRQRARARFDEQYQLTVLGGYTGSGKTSLLHELQHNGYKIINLEALANHKGSSFGALGEKPQPSQEMFENLLADALYSMSRVAGNAGEIFIEDESQRIGSMNIPDSFWKQMRSSRVVFLDIPFEERLTYLTEEYGKFDKAAMVNAVIRIQKRLGGLETKQAVNYLLENNHRECFRILLKYYDKYYEKGLAARATDPALVKKINCSTVDIKTNIQNLLHEKITVQ